MINLSSPQIVRVADRALLQNAISKGLVTLYQRVFSAAPYNEIHDLDNVERAFCDYVRYGILYVAMTDIEVVGFGAVVPFSRSDVAMLGSQFDFNPSRTWYMADLGVREDYRRNGLGTRLVKARLAVLPPGTNVLVRTSKYNNASLSLYTKLGFQLVPIIQNVSHKRQNKKTESDERVFMTIQLSDVFVTGPLDSGSRGLVRVRLWETRDDSSEEHFYYLPLGVIELLQQFVDEGLVAETIRPSLQEALLAFPLWADKSLDEISYREQRSSIAGKYIISNWGRISLESCKTFNIILY